MNNNLKNFIDYDKNRNYEALYYKYKKKYLLTKKYLKNQKGSSFLIREESSTDSIDSLPFLKSVSSHESLSGEPFIPKVVPKRPITPFKSDRPESGLSREIREADERDLMSEEDPKVPKSSTFEPLEVFLTRQEDIERDIQLTIYTMAYNLLKRFNPLKIKNTSESFSNSKLVECVDIFFKLAKKIIDAIDQRPFRKLNQRQDIVNYINDCKISDKTDFKFMLNERKDLFLPVDTELGFKINYNKTFIQLSNSVDLGNKISTHSYDQNQLKNSLARILV